MPAPEGFEQLTAPEQLEYAARQAARGVGVDPDLVSAIGHRESGFNADAVGKLGEVGAFQIMPATGKALGYEPEQLADPVTNVEAGVKLLAQLTQKYNGDPHQIAAAYNGGESRVDTGRITPAAKGYANAITAEIARRQGRDVSKATDIPSPSELVEQSQSQQESELPFAERLGSGIVSGPTRLLETGYRAATGSSIPPPTTSALLGDAASTGMILAPGFRIGRLASAALQGGLGAVQALSQAAQEHAKGDASWAEQLHSMSDADLMTVGASTLGSATLGALLPGENARPLTQMGGLARAAERLGASDLAPRSVANRTGAAPMRAAVQEAFGKIDKAAVVDATDWRDAIVQRAMNGERIPSEVQAVVDRLQPVTKMVRIQQPVTVPSAVGGTMQVIGTDGQPLMQTVLRAQPTGRVTGLVGDLLDVNQRLGNMLNPDNLAASQALGHAKGNLIGLKDDLSTALTNALPRDQAALYETARGTALTAGQNNRALRVLERFANPDEGLLNGKGLYNDLTKGNAGARRVQMGDSNYQDLLDFARSVRRITTDPKRTMALFSILHTGGAGAIGYMANAAVPGAGLPTTAALLGARGLYAVATSTVAKRALDNLARMPVGSKAFTLAAGRLAMAYTLANTDDLKHNPPAPPAPPGPTPPPGLPPGSRVPPPM